MTVEMRFILVDWLNQVSSDYSLKRQTFHKAVMMIDRYLEKCKEKVKVSDFQMIGITCLHMSAKLEEIYPPHINSFAESTNDSVSTEQMNKMEVKISIVLGFNFDQFQTYHDWSTWFMMRWDEYVDESLSYLKHQFQLKFFE
jgi:cyclin A